jgi:hypothetical protein
VQEIRQKPGTFVSQSDLLAGGSGSSNGQAAETEEDLLPTGNEPVPPLVVKRLEKATEEELRKQLQSVKELDLESVQFTNQFLLTQAREFADEHKLEIMNGKTPPDYLLEMLQRRPDLAGLPFLKGGACRLSPNLAAKLQVHSKRIRRQLGNSQLFPPMENEEAELPIDRSTVHYYLRNGKKHFRWQESEGLPALQQILMGEGKKARLFLVECLFRIKDRKGTEALARRAIFDLDPGIREAALMGLKLRPQKEYRAVILKGLQYPWLPGAQHAAEALVALQMRDTVPDLIRLLNKADPQDPFARVVASKPVQFVRELVRVNHVRNCLMCHSPAFANTDPLRSLIPAPDQRYPSLFSRENCASQIRDLNRGIGFIRADVTYLRQDFSVPQPVANPGNLPNRQRFDYLVRERRMTREELARHNRRQSDIKGQKLSEHREAILFALRELTGKDMGSLPEEWKKLLSPGSHTPK